MVLTAWYVYAFVTQDSLALEIFGVALPSFSIAFLVVLPLLLFYFASVFHMVFYSLLGSWRSRKYEKDYERIIESVIDAYLGKENRNHNFKTERYELLGKLLDKSTVVPQITLEANLSNDKVNAVIRLLADVREGRGADLKKYNLSKSNPLVIQNNRNRLKNGQINAEDILINAAKYDDEFCKEAFVIFAKTSPLYAIEKYKSFMSKEALLGVLARINANDNTLEASNETIISLINMLKLEKSDYLEIAKAISHSMIPDQRMKLFEMLCEVNEDALEGYIYTLFDLEMLSLATELLDNSQHDEFMIFKAYRALKECGVNYDIKLFV